LCVLLSHDYLVRADFARLCRLQTAKACKPEWPKSLAAVVCVGLRMAGLFLAVITLASHLAAAAAVHLAAHQQLTHAYGMFSQLQAVWHTCGS
jgi:hypothetical protein